MIALLLVAGAQAKSWCASPLIVHEWGVEVFRGDGADAEGPPFPDWFHDSAGSPFASGGRVRDLPADTGERTLPVVHFYAPRIRDEVPVAIEVGFAEGRASAWYPQVDLLRPAHTAGASPQLGWDALALTPTPRNAPQATDVPWVSSLRDLEALYVNRGPESERFLFYEADTTERPAVAVAKSPSWTRDRPSHQLTNTSDWTVHDVFVVHHGPDGDFAFYAPAIPPGASVVFVLAAHPFDAPAAHLRERLVDAEAPVAPTTWDWLADECVMMRDPAVPVRQAAGHRLYGAEVDALLGVWAPRLFEAQGTTVVYREDPAALDALMPLAIYTDMFHFVDLRRTGLVVWEQVELQ